MSGWRLQIIAVYRDPTRLIEQIKKLRLVEVEGNIENIRITP